MTFFDFNFRYLIKIKKTANKAENIQNSLKIRVFRFEPDVCWRQKIFAYMLSSGSTGNKQFFLVSYYMNHIAQERNFTDKTYLIKPIKFRNRVYF